jgi:hypothetical protein
VAPSTTPTKRDGQNDALLSAVDVALQRFHHRRQQTNASIQLTEVLLLEDGPLLSKLQSMSKLLQEDATHAEGPHINLSHRVEVSGACPTARFCCHAIGDRHCFFGLIRARVPCFICSSAPSLNLSWTIRTAGAFMRISASSAPLRTR